MYNIVTSPQKQHQYQPPREYFWAQSNPLQFAAPTFLFCNNRPCKHRNWRHSRESHRNKAYQFSRAIEHRLRELGDEFTICTGCLKFPHKVTLDEAKVIMRRFTKLVREEIHSKGWTYEICRKLHVVLKQHGDHPHFDLIAYHNIPLCEQRVRRRILKLWRQAGGSSGSHRNLSSSVANATDYISKFAREDRPKVFNDYMKRFPLPATPLPVTWTSRGFWGRKPIWKQVERYWNDELQVLERKLSPQQQHWLEWIQEKFGGEIPRFETQEYRDSKQLEAALPFVLRDAPVQLECSHNSYSNNTPEQPRFTRENKGLNGNLPCAKNVPATKQSETDMDANYQPNWSDHRQDEHNTNRHVQFWLQPIHQSGKPTGKFRIAAHDKRTDYRGRWVSCRSTGRNTFNQAEIELILRYKQWRYPIAGVPGWKFPPQQGRQHGR